MATFGKQSSTPFGRNNTNMIVELLFLAFFFSLRFFQFGCTRNRFVRMQGPIQFCKNVRTCFISGTTERTIEFSIIFFSFLNLVVVVIASGTIPRPRRYRSPHYFARIFTELLSGQGGGGGGRDRARLSLSSSACCV